MDIDLPPGKYVVAVSGGVDSVALLHLLANSGEHQLVVAHFDHGIRPDSEEDYALVEQIAGAYGLPFAGEHATLGSDASEALARDARYAFLESILARESAKAIVTAHHQDDLLETVIFNLHRGTGRRGLSPLTGRDRVVRPLLALSKEQLIDYALQYGLVWREDSTNQDVKYSRNYIRRNVIPKLTPQARQQLLDVITDTGAINTEIEEEIAALLLDQHIDRLWFMQLPHATAKEVMASWLRSQNVRTFDAPTIERLVVAAKVNQPNSLADISGGWRLAIGTESLALQSFER